MHFAILAIVCLCLAGLVLAAQPTGRKRRKYQWPLITAPRDLRVFAKTSVKSLREKIAELTDRVTAITDLAEAEKRELTAADKTEIDGILGCGKKGEAGYKPGQIDALELELERAEKIEAQVAKMAQARVGASGPLFQAAAGPAGQLPPDEQPLRNRVRIPAQARYRHGRLRAFLGEDAMPAAYLAGQFYAAALFGNEVSRKWCADHGIAIQNALSGGDNSRGGFLVPPEIETAIIDLREQYGVARQYCRVRPMSRDTLSIPVRDGGLTAYAVGENTEITASDKKWKQVELTARKWGVLTKYSSELAEDAVISIADDLTQEIAYAFAAAEDNALFNGDGTSTYHGIVGLANAVAAGSTYTSATGNTSFGTLDMADFEGCVGKLPDYVGIQPAWFISKAGCWASMMALMNAAGGNTAEILAGERRATFMGYPVVWSPVLNKTLTVQASTIIAYFGDLRLAVELGSRRGMRVKVSEDRYMEYDQLGILGTERYDLAVSSPGTASVAGAVIALKTASS
jgi:HK97 family phage major capsid protein